MESFVCLTSAICAFAMPPSPASEMTFPGPFKVTEILFLLLAYFVLLSIFKVASMNHGRQDFYLAALDSRLIAVGGSCMDTEVLSSLEVYSPQLNSWSFGAALPRSTHCHAGATFKQHIYISGGTNELGGIATRLLLCYNYHMDTWEEKKKMSTPRVHHNMCTLGDHIYAIGGRDAFENDPMGSVECYSPMCDQWTWVAPLLEMTSHLGVAVWRGKMYVLGGEKSDHEPLNLVQVYDHEKDNWTRGRPLPERLIGVSGCICVLKSRKKIRSDSPLSN